jgi:thiamine-phosphate pyrophosphorylase
MTAAAQARMHGLYAVTDGPRNDLLDVCEDAIDGGARILQYRDKTRDPLRRTLEARALQALCAERGIPLIINDDVELAAAVGAAGVHLGEDDGSIEAARLRLGAGAIIGVSCYDSLARARAFAAAGADYLAFGAFHASPTKRLARRASTDLLRDSKPLGVPLVAIGGIHADNGRRLIDAGADCLAVVSVVFAAPDVRGAARRIADLFTLSATSPP